jgi:predicted nucleic acid-binding protein
MSRLVLDACVALKTVLVEPDSDVAHALIEDFANKIHDLIAPDILPVEVGHALTRAERQGVIDKGESRILFDQFLDRCPRLFSYDHLIDRSLELSSELRIGVFDCLYVALAENENCKVVTVDRRFLEVFPDSTVSLLDL